jgi:hypothetical protein
MLNKLGAQLPALLESLFCEDNEGKIYRGLRKDPCKSRKYIRIEDWSGELFSRPKHSQAYRTDF